MVNPTAGSFLIATPGLLDPNFRRTVVLLCDHGPQSSMGIVVNRPMQVPVTKFFPQLAGDFASPDQGALVHCGGPVETNRMLVLRHGSPAGELFHPIFDDVSLVGDIECALVEGADPELSPSDYRFFLGYAGWGEDQLSQELEENAWIVRPANPTLIFETPPHKIWSEALKEMGGVYSLYSQMPLDPSLN